MPAPIPGGGIWQKRGGRPIRHGRTSGVNFLKIFEIELILCYFEITVLKKIFDGQKAVAAQLRRHSVGKKIGLDR